VGENPDVIRRQLERTRDELTDTIDALGYKADVPARAKDRVTDTIDRARGAVAGTTAGVRERTPSAGDVGDSAGRAVGVARENPLGLAIGSLAAGFLLGMVLPSSRMEDERLGPVADSVKSHAMELGQEALEHGKEVASDAAEAAADTARQRAPEHAQELRDTAAQHTGAVTDEVRTR